MSGCSRSPSKVAHRLVKLDEISLSHASRPRQLYHRNLHSSLLTNHVFKQSARSSKIIVIPAKRSMRMLQFEQSQRTLSLFQQLEGNFLFKLKLFCNQSRWISEGHSCHKPITSLLNVGWPGYDDVGEQNLQEKQNARARSFALSKLSIVATSW